MAQKWIWLLLGGVVVLGVALALTVFNPRPVVEVVQSARVRDTAPSVEPDNLSQLVSGNTSFAFDLYQKLGEEGVNFLFSPYSISLAMTMLYGGAREDTERELAAALRFSLPREQLHSACNALELDILRRADSEGLELRTAHAIWGQRGFSFRQEYFDLLAVNYAVGLRSLDFRDDTEQSRIIINNWVNKETKGTIPELFQPGSISSDAVLCITDAVYFKGA
jgi:serpin B